MTNKRVWVPGIDVTVVEETKVEIYYGRAPYGRVLTPNEAEDLAQALMLAADEARANEED